jgi:hypothetical protein
MAPIRLYMDEDSMDRSLLNALRARAVDVITAFEAGRIERSDADHLDYATAQGRVLYTYNIADFYRLHMEYLAQGSSHAGIILARQQRYSVCEQMRRLLILVTTMSAEEMKNSVEFLHRWSYTSRSYTCRATDALPCGMRRRNRRCLPTGQYAKPRYTGLKRTA